jgi:hypothetical protein
VVGAPGADGAIPPSSLTIASMRLTSHHTFSATVMLDSAIDRKSAIPQQLPDPATLDRVRSRVAARPSRQRREAPLAGSGRRRIIGSGEWPPNLRPVQRISARARRAGLPRAEPGGGSAGCGAAGAALIQNGSVTARERSRPRLGTYVLTWAFTLGAGDENRTRTLSLGSAVVTAACR